MKTLLKNKVNIALLIALVGTVILGACCGNDHAEIIEPEEITEEYNENQ